jgi:hypothetical protein
MPVHKLREILQNVILRNTMRKEKVLERQDFFADADESSISG